MRYALRNQEKIVSKFGVDYLREAILASLDDFFDGLTEESMMRHIQSTEKWNEKYPTINIRDVHDKSGDDAQQFVILGKTYDVLRIAYIGRIKG